MTKPADGYASPASMMKWRKSGKRTAPSCWTRSHGVMNGRFAGSFSTEPTKSRSESIVGLSLIVEPLAPLMAIASWSRRRRRASPSRWPWPAAPPRAPHGRASAAAPRAARPSHVDLDRVAAQLHQLAARLRLALAHQLGERHGGGGE